MRGTLVCVVYILSDVRFQRAGVSPRSKIPGSSPARVSLTVKSDIPKTALPFISAHHSPSKRRSPIQLSLLARIFFPVVKKMKRGPYPALKSPYCTVFPEFPGFGSAGRRSVRYLNVGDPGS